MPLLTIENHVHLSLINLNIAPLTFLAFAAVAFTYLYILHIRNNPRPRLQVAHIQAEVEARNDRPQAHDRRAGADVRRAPFFRRISARLRADKQRDRPVAPLRIPFASFWLPLRHKFGDGRLDIGRQIQPTGVAKRRKRESKQRLLE